MRRFLASSLLFAAALARLQYWGVAIAGADFGCQTNGTCPLNETQVPLKALGHADGAGQMQHFVQDDQFNIFRLPVSWQYLVNNALGGPLDTSNLAAYDQLIQACLATGAHCMIDVHNFARWNDIIIGQSGTATAGGVTDEQFVSLWQQLATHYASEPRIMFGIMNEPHDLNVTQWAVTCQKVVSAVRGAGANEQLVLLPGTNFDSAATLVSSGSADLLMAIKNPDGTTDNLMLDIHKYLDINNSGTHAECVMDNIANFTIVAEYLRRTGRKGFISETGAGTEQSSGCFERFCAQNNFIAANDDVFVGFIAWGAGNFSTDYLLSLTPTEVDGKWYDNDLCWECVVGPWLYPNQTVPARPTPPAATASAKPNLGVPGQGRPGGEFGGVALVAAAWLVGLVAV